MGKKYDCPVIDEKLAIIDLLSITPHNKLNIYLHLQRDFEFTIRHGCRLQDCTSTKYKRKSKSCNNYLFLNKFLVGMEIDTTSLISYQIRFS